MKKQKSQSQESRRRTPATKPSVVSPIKDKTRSTRSSKRTRARRRKAFLSRIEKVYRTNRKQHIASLRGMGLRDPEGAYHDALLTILRACAGGRRDLAYLPHRLKSRMLTAQKAHYRYQNREVYESDGFWSGMVANDAPSSTHDLAVEVDYLFGRLDAYSTRILTWAYLDQRTNAEISALTGRSKANVKSDLHRARKKARRILSGFREADEKGCNHPDVPKG